MGIKNRRPGAEYAFDPNFSRHNLSGSRVEDMHTNLGEAWNNFTQRQPENIIDLATEFTKLLDQLQGLQENTRLAKLTKTESDKLIKEYLEFMKKIY